MTTEKKPRNKAKIFQKDENDENILLVPAENLKSELYEVPERHIRTQKPVSEEVRLRQIERGKALGALRREKYKLVNEEKAKLKLEAEEKEAKDKQEELEAHKKEIERKLLSGELVRVRVKPKVKYNKQEKPEEPKEKKSKVVIETDTEETDADDRQEQRKMRKTAYKTAKAIAKIDEVIQQATTQSKYLDRLTASMR